MIALGVNLAVPSISAILTYSYRTIFINYLLLFSAEDFQYYSRNCKYKPFERNPPTTYK